MAMFLKFVGPMASLTIGKTRFEKDRIYKFLNEDQAFDMIETGRFRQTRDPSQGADERPRRQGKVRIRSRSDEEPTGGQSERGDLSLNDLKSGGGYAGDTGSRDSGETFYVYKVEGSDEEHHTTDMNELLKSGHIFVRKEEPQPRQKDGAEGEVPEVAEAKAPEDDTPKLPAQPFTSKRSAAEWAQKNLGVKLDTKKSIVALNNQIVEEHAKKFGKPDSADELDDDDVREENTDLEAVTVA